jgi:tetratricopeptide (TPR) repeat protein
MICMKRLFFPLVLLVVALFVKADGPDDQYVQVYKLIQEGDQLQGNGQNNLAREKYLQAQNNLKKLQVAHPDWNQSVVQFRLNYVTEKLGAVAKESPASPVLEKDASAVKKPAVPKPSGAADEKQITALREEIGRLQGDKAVLEAKLKEALSAQPAAIDPRELTKAEEKIKVLEKEKELLRVSLEQEQSKQATAVAPSAVEELKKLLTTANEQLVRERETAKTLANEKLILETRLQSALREAEALKVLRSENDNLKKQLADAKPGTPVIPASSGRIETELAAAKATAQTNAVLVARLQSELKTLQEEKAALEKVKKDLEARLAGSGSERVKKAESERDELLKKLNTTTKQLYDNKARTESVQREQYDKQLAVLRARLEVLEAPKVPFTPEELALFKKTELSAAKVDPKAKVDTKAGKKPLKELPRGAGPILADAERAFAARRYDEAEKKYHELLKLDDKNVFTLANLAAIQLQQNRMDDAEANLKRALAEDASDTRSVSLWGYMKFRQEKFDEALDSLSRAAQLDPQNPEIQNYLGITLSHKGQRGPAETALRKAIQIAPSFGDAHQNLAVIYASQQPPFKELARWHYQKSLACGNPQNSELEKMIESASVPAPTPTEAKP